MIKKTQLTIFAAMVLSCSMSYGQVFETISPSSLGLTQGATGITQTFDIGTRFGQSASAVQLLITNGNVATGQDLFTVGQSAPATRFDITSSVPLESFIQHGGVLGSQSAQSGTGVSDGFNALDGAQYTLVSPLDSDYVSNVNGNIYDVTYIGVDDGIQSNSSAFRWVSTQPVSSFNVFSNNTVELVNNFSIGFRDAAAIPEPSTTALMALASTFWFVRRKRS